MKTIVALLVFMFVLSAPLETDDIVPESADLLPPVPPKAAFEQHIPEMHEDAHGDTEDMRENDDDMRAFILSGKLHPKLIELAKAQIRHPHELHEILLNPGMPLNALLSTHMGRLSCQDAQAAFGKSNSALIVKAPAMGASTSLSTRDLDAEVLESSGESASAQDAMMLVLVRSFRTPKVARKVPTSTLVEFKGTKVDPESDVVFEAKPVVTDGVCKEWLLRHPEEGVAQLSKLLETNNKETIKSIIRPLHATVLKTLHNAGVLKTVTRPDGSTHQVLGARNVQASSSTTASGAESMTQFKAKFDAAQDPDQAIKVMKQYAASQEDHAISEHGASLVEQTEKSSCANHRRIAQGQSLNAYADTATEAAKNMFMPGASASLRQTFRNHRAMPYDKQPLFLKAKEGYLSADGKMRKGCYEGGMFSKACSKDRLQLVTGGQGGLIYPGDEVWLGNETTHLKGGRRLLGGSETGSTNSKPTAAAMYLYCPPSSRNRCSFSRHKRTRLKVHCDIVEKPLHATTKPYCKNSGKMWFSLKEQDRVPYTSRNTPRTRFGRLEYLDRQNVQCPGGYVMTEHRLKRHGNHIWYEYQCMKAPIGTHFFDTYTRCAAAAGKNIEFLDRQDVKCPGGAIQSFHFIRQGCGSRDMRYKLKCARVKNEHSAYKFKGATDCQSGRGGQIDYLDRHHLVCNQGARSNMALQSFKLTGAGCARHQLKFEYTCVELIPRKRNYFCDYSGGPPTIDAYLSEQNGVQMYKRDLPNYAGDLQRNDPTSCMRLCDGKGSYRFFAVQRVQNQFKCFCGDSFGQPPQLYPKVDSQCNHEGVNNVYTRADSDQLTKVKAMCKEEDEKEANCAEEAVMDFYKHDICMGASCSLAENAVASMIISLVIWIADEIIGCALGFWCKPSFWISVTKGSTGNDAKEASGAEKITKVGAGAAGKVVAQKALYTGAEKAAQKAMEKAGAVATKEAFKNAANQGASTAGQVGAAGMAKAKNVFKNMVPCLPAAVLAILDGGATFGTCMITCLKSALGVKIGMLVFTLIKSCLWDIIKDALSGCFPADATVQLSSGQTVPMVKLQIGDEILAGDGTWSTVYVMSHQDSTRTAEFVELKLKNHTIVATEGHFLPVSKMCDEASEDMRAGDVAVGMCLFTMGVGETRSSLKQVLTKGRVFKKGLFNPFTMQGTLAVNGVVASSHSEWFLDNVADSLSLTHLLPTAYQAVLAPARGLYSAVTWLVGIEKVNAQLEEYKTDMAHAAENNLVFKPYFDLFVRAVKLVSTSIGGHQ